MPRRRSRKKSSLSLLASPKFTFTYESNPKLHETIDLVDDDDDNDDDGEVEGNSGDKSFDVYPEPIPLPPPPNMTVADAAATASTTATGSDTSQVQNPKTTTETYPDLILIDEVEASDTSSCATPMRPSNEPGPSSSTASSKSLEESHEVIEVCDETDGDEIEILGIRIVAPPTTSSRGTPLRMNNSRSSKKLTPLSSRARKNRRSTRSSSIAFSNVQQVIKRAKLRMSNSPLARIAPSSLAISKKNKKKKKKSQQLLAQSPAANNNRGISGISARFLRSRRHAVPVFNTLQELGPANPQFRHRLQNQNPNFIPVSSNRFGNFGESTSNNGHINPFVRAPFPHHQSQNKPRMPPVPAGPNNINVNPNLNQFEPGAKRPIVIDGSNVAMAHGNNQQFSCRGIKICAQFFLDRGHTDVTAFVPQFRTKASESVDPHILEELNKQGIVKFTPSREVDGRRIASYDDRFIVQCAVVNNGIIISNDNYRDLYKDEPEWRETILNRILQFTWVNQEWLMFPNDPLGKRGPLLDEFLLF